jgi:hypothetical protein
MRIPARRPGLIMPPKVWFAENSLANRQEITKAINQNHVPLHRLCEDHRSYPKRLWLS